MRLEIERVEIERLKPKPKSKNDSKVATLKERLRRLDVVYMAGNKTDEAYLKEQKEIKDELQKVLSDEPENLADRDITIMKETLESDFKTVYETLDDEDKRAFWRYVIKEIKVQGNEVASVVFN